ncbi:hypothetical protein DICPUDRAFT_57657 [Dictyostelium purpureum]|uniref:Carbohydrate binding domain-containing protein n=1 Tax=Dictyostelium purpureum TaxID=5786 RepID=F0ZWY4_DICPU|nr:uncharacterized protein DICPUDRAFT_57657 [Dictyostelium purpureum]EGC31558.1 hypothetical protein DICPUDRAFT_57657 [Dictyostelium purpureum]|eukprot:XP_003291929.1 hypothetical protein DICPUDRAFT_57657 [Dictyostelium purpureum]
MKLITIILIFFLINLSKSQSCDKFLEKFKDSNKCIQMSIAGSHILNQAIDTYKGNLKYNNVTNTLEINGTLTNLQSYESICIDGLYQPFSAMDSFIYKDFKIFSNGTLRINNVFFANLVCFPNDDFVYFKLNNFLYSLSMRAYSSCPILYFGEACILSTPPPTTTPTTTPPSNYNIKFENTLNSQWEKNNTLFYQFTTILQNNENYAFSSIEIVNDGKWGVLEAWNLNKLENGNYGFPGYVSKIEPKETFTFGFVSTIRNPSFTIKSVIKA